MTEKNAIKTETKFGLAHSRWLGGALSLYFGALLCWAIFFALKFHADGGQRYRIGDWLINYSGGFVRRGASGELLLFLNNILFHDLLLTTLVVQIALYAVFLATSLSLLLRRKGHLTGFVLLIFSPAVFLFELLNPASYRKELLFFALLGVLSWLAVRRSSQTPKYLLAALYIMPVLILCHEMLIVFVPYLFLSAMAACPEISMKNKKYWLPLCLMLLAFGLAATHPGNARTALDIKNALHGQVPEKSLGPNAAIDALGLTTSNALKMVAERIGGRERYLEMYGLALWLTSLAFIPVFGRLKSLFKRWAARAFLAATVIGTLGLMTVAVDWGRFIHIHAVCLFMVLLCTPVRPRMHENPIRVFPWGIAGMFFCLVYAVTWRLPIDGGTLSDNKGTVFLTKAWLYGAQAVFSAYHE